MVVIWKSMEYLEWRNTTKSLKGVTNAKKCEEFKNTVWSVNDGTKTLSSVGIFGFPILFPPALSVHLILTLLPVMPLATSERPLPLQSVIASFELGTSTKQDLSTRYRERYLMHHCPCMFHQACKPIIYYHCCVWCRLQPLSGLHYCSQPGESILVLAARGRSRSSVRPLCQRWVINESGWVSTRDDFELEFSGSSRAIKVPSQAKPSWGTLIFELKPNWQYRQYECQKMTNFLKSFFSPSF